MKQQKKKGRESSASSKVVVAPVKVPDIGELLSKEAKRKITKATPKRVNGDYKCGFCDKTGDREALCAPVMIVK